MMSFAEHSSDLLRIIEIDERIKQIEHSRNYLKFRRSLNLFEKAQRRGLVILNSSDNQTRQIRMRLNSSEARRLISEIREKIRDDVEEIAKLRREREALWKKLRNNNSKNAVKRSF